MALTIRVAQILVNFSLRDSNKPIKFNSYSPKTALDRAQTSNRSVPSFLTPSAYSFTRRINHKVNKVQFSQALKNKTCAKPFLEAPSNHKPANNMFTICCHASLSLLESIPSQQNHLAAVRQLPESTSMCTLPPRGSKSARICIIVTNFLNDL